MFKNYLRIHPTPIQLFIFLTFWCALMLLGLFLQPLYIKAATGIGSDQLQAFLEKDMYNHPNVIFVSNALFQVFTFLLPAIIYAYLADPQPVKYLGGTLPGKKTQPFWVIILAIGLIFLIAPLGTWLKEIDLGKTSKALDEQREKFIMSYLSSGNVWTILRSILLIAIVPAFCEELFFRGVLMKFAHTLFKKWWLSIIISSLLFAAFHTSISEFVPIFLAGIILGSVYYLTSSIWMSILLHLLFNGLQVVLGMYSNPQMEKSMEQQGTLLSVFGIAAVIVGVCLFMLNKGRTPLPANWSVVKPEVKEQEWDVNA
jgi:membrane protease YdiL (CAAX protease family)